MDSLSLNAPTGVVTMQAPGPPAVLRYGQETVGAPGPGQVRVRQAAIGVNFVDTYFRNGTFAVHSFPFVPGVEAAGTIEAVGPNVTGFRIGDRVAYHFVAGAYAEVRLMSTNGLVHLPDKITLTEAAAVTTKGLMAWALLRRIYPVPAGTVVLVHAAAGGVGSLTARWARALGATVIGTVGTAAKLAAVQPYLDHAIATDQEDFAARVLEITAGQGVDVVYDGVGQATFAASVPVVKPGGTLVLYGASSGQPQSLAPAELARRQLTVVRPVLGTYLPTQAVLEQAAAEVYAALERGWFGELTTQTYSLAQAAQAHADLEDRRTTGSVLLLP
ncbi:quinone oxidoreductase family protein [Hymenobacter fodinae]|uniref:Quinone oxidoreductase n=1 Tax=Hymenobacter fodinae TaxID=2510796 RepID=A0A4Z0P048_9BACT|nr:quinone oxidoreductase [Hymenobacter fodinae]TGE03776.1 quinone oxidoreductase [Hymenobacter fodinae]